jgi:hypothetical protein
MLAQPTTLAAPTAANHAIRTMLRIALSFGLVGIVCRLAPRQLRQPLIVSSVPRRRRVCLP